MKKITLLMLPLAMILMACMNPNKVETADETADATPQEDQAQNEETKSTAMDVSPKRFAKLMENKEEAIILDVRTDSEVAGGVIPGAQQMDFRSGEFKERIVELDKSKPVLVYCASGKRSAAAMEAMSKMGFTEVYNLTGGITKWKIEDRLIEPLAK